VHRSWLYKLLARYRREGEAGLDPRSKRPHRSPQRISDLYEDEIVALRKELLDRGVDAGAATIHTHLTRRHGTAVWECQSDLAPPRRLDLAPPRRSHPL
jgi:hypothetical protein